MSNQAIVFNNSDLSVPFESKPILINGSNMTITLEYAGANPKGIIKIYASNDPSDDLNSVAHWVFYFNSDRTVPASKQDAYELYDFYYKWLKVTWTPDVGGSVGTLFAERFSLVGK